MLQSGQAADVLQATVCHPAAGVERQVLHDGHAAEVLQALGYRYWAIDDITLVQRIRPRCCKAVKPLSR
jgi:hypothetical protein